MRLGASSFETVKKPLLEFYESNQITHDLCSAQLRPETVPERKIVRCGQERDQVAEAAQSYAKAAQFEAVVSASGDFHNGVHAIESACGCHVDGSTTPRHSSKNSPS
jgi:hypothetical protein